MSTSQTTRHSALVTTPSPTQIVITREFAAPAAHVWTALTTPELVKRWWCGERGVVTSAEIDLRVGGLWRYVMVAHGGFEVAFHGEYQELVVAERIVSTEVFEGFPDDYSVNTVTLTPSATGTILRTVVQHNSQQARDMHIDSGMEGGMQEAFDALEDVAVGLST